MTSKVMIDRSQVKRIVSVDVVWGSYHPPDHCCDHHDQREEEHGPTQDDGSDYPVRISLLGMPPSCLGSEDGGQDGCGQPCKRQGKTAQDLNNSGASATGQEEQALEEGYMVTEGGDGG